MSDMLFQAWKTGHLLRPDASLHNTVDLVSALAWLGGDTGRPIRPNADDLAVQIGPSEHLVFVLIDGLGINLLELLPAEAFLRTHRTREIRSVFPSTTSAAITTLATGLWPCEHGVLGWWLYLVEHGISVTALPFLERMTQAPLERRSLKADILWPFEPILARVWRNVRSIHPAAFWNSTFTQFARGGKEGTGYTSITSAVDQVVGRIATASEPTYTYLYLPELDDTCHHFGTDSTQTMTMLLQIDREMARLGDAIHGRARLVISADHGHQNVSAEDHLALRDGDALLETLISPPTGEPRVPYFHVRPGQHDAFLSIFNERYGHRIALLTVDTADELRLFGPWPLSAVARRRLGNYVGIAVDPVTLMYYPPARTAADHASHHAGMSPAEMRVPLILA